MSVFIHTNNTFIVLHVSFHRNISKCVCGSNQIKQEKKLNTFVFYGDALKNTHIYIYVCVCVRACVC